MKLFETFKNIWIETGDQNLFGDLLVFQNTEKLVKGRIWLRSELFDFNIDNLHLSHYLKHFFQSRGGDAGIFWSNFIPKSSLRISSKVSSLIFPLPVEVR